jgi:hypothetical protein
MKHSLNSLLGKMGRLMSHNAFAYCKGNPGVLIDSTGMRSEGNVLRDALESFEKVADEEQDE